MSHNCTIPSKDECSCGARYKYRWTHTKTGKTGVREMILTPICKNNHRFRFDHYPTYREIYSLLISDWNKSGPWKYEEI